MKEVDSSAVESIGYDPATNTLHVKYANGDKIYEYPDITADDHTGLLNADSIGRHLQQVIAPKSKGPL